MKFAYFNLFFWLLLTGFRLYFSGYTTDNIRKIVQGERVGTVFHQDSHLWTIVKEVGAREMAVAARECSRRLQVSKTEVLKSCKAISLFFLASTDEVCRLSYIFLQYSAFSELEN